MCASRSIEPRHRCSIDSRSRNSYMPVLFPGFKIGSMLLGERGPGYMSGDIGIRDRTTLISPCDSVKEHVFELRKAAR